MDITEIVSLVTNNGFAVIVAFYSLTRLERTMKENTEVMKEVLINLRGDL